jgi:hypothetical protein
MANAKELYNQAYSNYERKKYNKLIEICSQLLKEYPDSKEARWALKNFPITWDSINNNLFLTLDKHDKHDYPIIDKKYSALYTYASIGQLIGWIIFVIGITFGFILVFSEGIGILFIYKLLYSSMIVLSGLTIVAASKLMCVWADTEENTRRIATLLEKSNILENKEESENNK